MTDLSRLNDTLRRVSQGDRANKSADTLTLIDAARRYLEDKPDPSLLAGISELAARYGVQPNTVAVWTQRHEDFPAPLLQVGGRVRVWWVPDVDQWVEKRGN